MPCTAGTTLLVWSIGRHLELKSESHYTEEKQTRVIIAIHVVSKMTSTLFLWFNIVIRGASGIATCSTATSTTINRTVSTHFLLLPTTHTLTLQRWLIGFCLSQYVLCKHTLLALSENLMNIFCSATKMLQIIVTFTRYQAILKESTKKLDRVRTLLWGINDQGLWVSC
jgi:hypothetical protein